MPTWRFPQPGSRPRSSRWQGIPAAWPGGNRAGPGHGALLRRRDHPQLHRPARLRPHLSGWHSGSGRPHATGKTDPVRLLNAIEVPWQPASPAELTFGPGICKPPVPPAAPSPPCRQGEGPGRVGPWSVARAPVVGWTGCYERAPGRRGVTGLGPRTAQSRSARRGGGASRLSPARVGSQRAGQVDDAFGRPRRCTSWSWCAVAAPGRCRSCPDAGRRGRHAPDTGSRTRSGRSSRRAGRARPVTSQRARRTGHCRTACPSAPAAPAALRRPGDVNRGMTAVEARTHLLIAGFDVVVEFLGDPFPQLSEQRAGILARRGDPQQPTQQRHVAQVGFHRLRDAWILHLSPPPHGHNR